MPEAPLEAGGLEEVPLIDLTEERPVQRVPQSAERVMPKAAPPKLEKEDVERWEARKQMAGPSSGMVNPAQFRQMLGGQPMSSRDSSVKISEIPEQAGEIPSHLGPLALDAPRVKLKDLAVEQKKAINSLNLDGNAGARTLSAVLRRLQKCISS